MNRLQTVSGNGNQVGKTSALSSGFCGSSATGGNANFLDSGTCSGPYYDITLLHR